MLNDNDTLVFALEHANLTRKDIGLAMAVTRIVEEGNSTKISNPISLQI